MVDVIGSVMKPVTTIRNFFLGDVPKFGAGNDKKELEECPDIHVFMVCYGQSTVEKRKAVMEKSTTIRQARDDFGRPMKQELICDENHFRFNENDLDKALYKFSNKCHLNLAFIYENHINTAISKISDLSKPPKT
jgi:hypothetical protein